MAMSTRKKESITNQIPNFILLKIPCLPSLVALRQSQQEPNLVKEFSTKQTTKPDPPYTQHIVERHIATSHGTSLQPEKACSMVAPTRTKETTANQIPNFRLQSDTVGYHISLRRGKLAASRCSFYQRTQDPLNHYQRTNIAVTYFIEYFKQHLVPRASEEYPCRMATSTFMSQLLRQQTMLSVGFSH